MHNRINFQGNEHRKSALSSAKKKIVLVNLQLWEEFQNGSESAFATIYEKHVALLYSYGLKLIYDKELVKDAVQDLFIELWDAKNRLAKVQSIKAYLYKSLRRKLIAFISKERKTFDKNREISNLVKRTPSAEVSLIEKQRFNEQREALNKALTTLSDKQKEIIHLKFYGRLNYNEISEIMSLDKKGVYNLMARSIKVLKQNLASLVLLTALYLDVAIKLKINHFF